MNKKTFEQLVNEGISALPAHAKAAMQNVAFVIENDARSRKTGEVGIKVGEVLLGLYEGIPKTERGSNYFGNMPDKITLFQKSIEELVNHDEKKLKKLIYEVVWHEVGHHLGFDEKEIRALETKRRKTKHYII